MKKVFSATICVYVEDSLAPATTHAAAGLCAELWTNTMLPLTREEFALIPHTKFEHEYLVVNKPTVDQSGNPLVKE